MKSLIYLLTLTLLLLMGCNNEFLTGESSDLKKANVPIPMKAWFCMTPDFTLDKVHVANTPFVHPVTGQILAPSLDLPGGGYISGHATHMGEVIAPESFSKTISAKLVMLSSGPFVLAEYEGRITAANGDYYLFKDVLKISLPDMSFNGEVNMFGGTGKFAGMTGTVAMTGQADPVNMKSCWTGEGTMIYEK